MNPLFISVCLLGVFGFIMFKLYRFILRMGGGSKSRIKKDKKELLILSSGFEDEMVPVTSEELLLLSSKVETEEVKHRIFYTERGVLNSIYEEPIASYGYREYGEGKSLLVATTKESQFEFTERDGLVDMKINGYLQGVIQEDGTLLGVHGEEIAAIDNHLHSGYRTMSIRERKVAELLNPTIKTSETNTRVFLELKQLDQVEQNILFGMTIYNTLIKT